MHLITILLKNLVFCLPLARFHSAFGKVHGNSHAALRSGQKVSTNNIIFHLSEIGYLFLFIIVFTANCINTII